MRKQEFSTIMVQNTGRWLPYFGAQRLQEHFLQIVQEAPAQCGGAQAGRIGVEQAAPGRCFNWCAMAASDRPVRSPNEGAATPSSGAAH